MASGKKKSRMKNVSFKWFGKLSHVIMSLYGTFKKYIYIYSLRKGVSCTVYCISNPTLPSLGFVNTPLNQTIQWSHQTKLKMGLRRFFHPQRIKATYFLLRRSPVQLTPGKSTLAELSITRFLCLPASSQSPVPHVDILDSFLSREEITHTQTQILKCSLVFTTSKDHSVLPRSSERSCYRHG